MPPLQRLAAFYATIYLGVGVMMTFLPVHLRALGVSASAMSLLFAGRTALSVVVPPLWGLWADRRGDARLPARVAAVLAAVTFFPLLFVGQFDVVAPLLLLQALGAAALAPLADSMTLGVLRNAPERFGRVRLAGSVSYGVGVVALALLLPGPDDAARMGRAGAASVPVMCVTLACSVVAALLLPAVGRPRLDHAMALTGSLRRPTLWLLLAAGAVHWAAHTPYAMFLGVHLEDLGLGPGVAAASIAVAVSVEVAVLFASAALLRRVSTERALALCFGLGLLRWGLDALINQAWAFVAVQALHGVTFGFWFLVMVRAVQAEVPEHARSTAQGLLTAVVFGLGGVAGLLLTGAAYDAGRGPGMFLACAALEAGALGLLGGLVLARRRAVSQSPPWRLAS